MTSADIIDRVSIPTAQLRRPETQSARSSVHGDLWRAWSLDPTVVLLLAVSATVYVLGARRFAKRGVVARRSAARRFAPFAVGLLVLGLALLSPLDTMSSALFAAHMTQHLLIVVVAAPLLVLGDPMYVMMWAVPLGARRTIGAWWLARRALRGAWRALSHPVMAWSLHIATLWVWHAPPLYDWALRDERVHALEHTTFLLTALLFWWVVLDRHRLGVGAAIFYLFAAALQSTLLGALITLAKHPWYASHLATTSAWGLTPLEDQQLAGLIMWIPAGMIYVVAMAPRLIRELSDSRHPRELEATSLSPS